MGKNPIPKSFRGYAGEPQSEMEVVFLFGLLYKYLPFPFVVREINDTFPDCKGIDPITKKPVNIEFELFSRNYDHPIKECHYIVCWEDNWPDSPITVISLKSLIERKNLAGKCFIDIPAPGSVGEKMEELKDANPQAYRTVKHFLDVSLKKVQREFPGLYVDTKRTKHYGVKYLGNKSLGIGIYPSGKLVCKNVDEIVKTYGKSVRKVAIKMRHIVKKEIGILQNNKQSELVAKSLKEILLAISKTNK
jgi:hypothetical protein